MLPDSALAFLVFVGVAIAFALIVIEVRHPGEGGG